MREFCEKSDDFFKKRWTISEIETEIRKLLKQKETLKKADLLHIPENDVRPSIQEETISKLNFFCLNRTGKK